MFWLRKIWYIPDVSFIIELTSARITLLKKLQYICSPIESFQVFLVNDVKLSPGPRIFASLFDKHIEYIANHENDQNDYVR